MRQGQHVQRMNRASIGREDGLTLVELMISLVIGMLLVAGMIALFVGGSKQTYRNQEQLARVQENARYAFETLSFDVRMAGFMGCAPGDSISNTLNNKDAIPYKLSVGVEGYEATGTGVGSTLTLTSSNPNNSTNVAAWAPALPNDATYSLSNQVIEGNDVLVVRSAGLEPVRVTRTNNSAQLFAEYEPLKKVIKGCGETDSFSGLCEGDVLLVTDCQKGRVFQTTQLNDAGGDLNVVHAATAKLPPGNAEPSWGGNSRPPEEQFTAGAEIYKVKTTVYFVGRGSGGEPSLFRRVGTAAPEELIEGVENMQVLYGLGPAIGLTLDEYRTANNIATNDWSRVRSVRIALLLRSSEQVADQQDASTYNLAGTVVNPVDDRRLRRPYTITIALRNRAG